MKRSFGFIAAALLTTSVYSQGYDSNSAAASPSEGTSVSAQSAQDQSQSSQAQTPNFDSRQSEAGAPGSSQADSSASYSGFERDAGSSNTTTGLSSGSNKSQSDSSQPSQSTESTSGDAHSSISTSGSLDSSGSANSTTIGTDTSANASLSTGVDASLNADVDGAASRDASISADVNVSDRDADLRARGLEADSQEIRADKEGRIDIEGNLDDDSVAITEETSVTQPHQSVGGPAGSESGAASSNAKIHSDVQVRANMDHDAYAHELSERVRSEFKAGSSDDDVEVRVYQGNDYKGTASGSAATSETGTVAEGLSEAQDAHKNAAQDFHHPSVRSSGSALDADERYNNSRNDEASGTSAPADQGERSSESQLDDSDTTSPETQPDL